MVDSKGRDLFDLWISLHNDVIQTVEIITQESETNIDLDHNYCSSYSKRQTTSKDYDKPTDNGGLNLASEPRRRNEDKSIDEHVQLDFESQNTSKDKEDPRRNDYLKLYGRNQPTYDLTLRNNIQAHHESNCGENLSILGECPILRWLFEEGETLMNVDIPLNKWLTHLAQHKQNVCGYISLILESPDMGLYFNLVENRHVEEAVHSTMKEMADRLAISCPILKSVVELRGSRCEGAKVGYPDEFDYIFYLTEFETAVVPEESNEHGYVRLRIIREEDRMKFKDFINEDGFVDALKVIPKIFMCYNSVIEDEGFMKRANLYPLKMLDPLKYSIDNFEFLWTGPTYKRMKVSVDIVPAIRLSTWMPECVNTSPKLLREFHIKPQVSAVFKTQNYTLKKAWSTYFRVSVASMESGVLRALPASIRKGFILIKALKDSTYFPKVSCLQESETEEFITTYMIKCAFLHEIESHVQDVQANPANLIEEETNINVPIVWAKRTIHRMKRGFEEKSLKAFFMNDINFLADGIFSDASDALRVGKVEIQCLEQLLQCFDDKRVVI